MSGIQCHICSGSEIKLLMKKNGFDFFRCRNCRLEFIFPQPDNAALEKIYSESYYDSWGLHLDAHAAQKSKRLTFEYRLDLVSKFLKPRDAILDCGCATGFFLDLAAEKKFLPYGVEISDFAADVCRKKFETGNIFQGNFEDAEFEGNKENFFSAVFMTDYLEHVRSPRAVLETAFRFLKPGGMLVITTPDTSSLSHSIMNHSWIHYKTEHLFYFSKVNLEQLLTQTGFIEIRKRKGWKYFTLEYIHQQLITYRHAVFTPVIQAMHKIAHDVLRKKTFRIHAGEMIVIAQKPLSEKPGK